MKSDSWDILITNYSYPPNALSFSFSADADLHETNSVFLLAIDLVTAASQKRPDICLQYNSGVKCHLGCNYLSMLRLKSIHVSKRHSRWTAKAKHFQCFEMFSMDWHYSSGMRQMAHVSLCLCRFVTGQWFPYRSSSTSLTLRQTHDHIANGATLNNISKGIHHALQYKRCKQSMIIYYMELNVCIWHLD